MKSKRELSLVKWVKQNAQYMNIPGCEVILGYYLPESDMRKLSGFISLGQAKEAVKRMGMEEHEYVILYNNSLPDTGKFITQSFS